MFRTFWFYELKNHDLYLAQFAAVKIKIFPDIIFSKQHLNFFQTAQHNCSLKRKNFKILLLLHLVTRCSRAVHKLEQ